MWCLDCTNGNVLLMNGSVPAIVQREGRVEICYNNEYHTICDDFWDVSDAEVVCRQLNVSGDSKLLHFLILMVSYVILCTIAHFAIRGEAVRYGRGTGTTLLDNIDCTGDEATLLECNHRPVGDNDCAVDHSEDAAVACGGNVTVILWDCIFSNSSFSCL